ncbi:MAG: transglycosylase domain-containing protein, partial [Anaerolineaceae bacterium]|nr:transglycosylase domain-containing protein [Anaerolineaceae bacterium]
MSDFDPTQPNPNDNESTKPGERLRRLLASSQEEGETLPPLPESPDMESTTASLAEDLMAAADGEATQPPAPAAGSPSPDLASTTASLAEDLMAAADGEAGEEPQPETPAEMAPLPPAEELLAEGMESMDVTQPAPLPEDRHPTGEPDQTGGWYGELETGEPLEPPVDTPAQPAAVTQAHVPLEQTPPHLRPTQAHPIPQAQAVPPPPPGVRREALPQQVDAVDMGATQVSPSAYVPPGGRSARQAGAPARPAQSARQKPPKPPRKSNGNTMGCMVRGFIFMLFLGVILLVLAGAVVVVQYFTIQQGLPSVEDLRQRASQFETTRILDRNNNVLYEIIDPNAGRRTYVPLEKISPYVIAATIATEDKEFYNNPGWDPIAIARALWSNLLGGDVVSGASTITQQLARILLLPDEKYEVSYNRKAREIVLAAEITRLYSKEEILELYLNEINYGNLSYGIEAAAESYFNTTADRLTLGQASFLTGIPQAPGVYDIFTARDATLLRQSQVLGLMYTLSEEKGCIFVMENVDRVCVSQADFAAAALEIGNYPFQRARNTARYPHWVDYIRAELEERYDPQTIYRSGFTVYTTIDPSLQAQAEELVKNQVAALTDKNVQDGALLAIRPSTGEILAMVGSADYYNEAISGQVNMTLAPRQPGSSIKPLTYAAAFEKGWTPSTVIWDIPSKFPPSGIPSDPMPSYEPVNYDGRFHGPVTLRSALANSFNIPAVKALQYIGVYDDPAVAGEQGLVAFARRLGITTLTRPDYGLALTLGGGDVSLMEMTGAYAVFANGGRRIDPVAITRIVDRTGTVVYEYQVPPGDQVVRAEHAYLISSILSDNEARAPMFGYNSVLALPFPAAVKTGTTNDFRDNWTIGYTPDLAVGVWVGNADYTPMQNTTGLTGAAPIWASFMEYAIPQLTGGTATPFVRPAGIVDRVICAVSGTEPSDRCPSQRSELFAADQLPLPRQYDFWSKTQLETWTG